MSDIVKILLVEDNPDHVVLISHVFRSHGNKYEIDNAPSLVEARKKISEAKHDITITDLNLPDGNGIELLPAEGGEPEIPLIVLTGQGGEKFAVDAMKRGALDYVVKDGATMADLPHVVDIALSQWKNIVERRQAEQALKLAKLELEERVRERTAALAESKVILEIDIEARKKTEKELMRREEQLRELSRKLLTMQEEERKRLARELHDELGQQLSTMSLEIEWLKRQDRPEKSHIDSLFHLQQSVFNELRRICRGLHPMILDRFGLSMAMEALLKELMAQSDIQIRKSISRIEKNDISAEEAVCIYRIFQESLTNIMRHSHASNAEVALEVIDGDIVLTVSDNGTGFSTDEVEDKGRGIGLVGMSERAALCGGELAIESEAGKGTKVRLVVPMNGG